MHRISWINCPSGLIVPNSVKFGAYSTFLQVSLLALIRETAQKNPSILGEEAKCIQSFIICMEAVIKLKIAIIKLCAFIYMYSWGACIELSGHRPTAPPLKRPSLSLLFDPLCNKYWLGHLAARRYDVIASWECYHLQFGTIWKINKNMQIVLRHCN